ncbi:MAG: hypothetical protein COU90_03595 [Candidatus Ryanbacteria bacterium CG10_big_fil_rev_8_21_14_0_10_43_42]|uniref:Uncharacterized protein n=1 Tax=Candidatus Ryanbacteria bacterium CG10_big_fil_rev_8_21_14_0_10_43_42 TaxID=1974864 RepID=A0A2M8KWG5_9BACT|nr:MAG: hypothetical protein COU90_03595 [Candidatus Ryanbacteria bacterium CG10_big_fil_rev_8_21_14_0_10_43_42]
MTSYAHVNRICILILFFVLLLARTTTVPVQAQTNEVSSVPILNLIPYHYYPLEDVFYIEGMSDPFMEIELEVRADGRDHFTFRTHADKNGSWTLAERIILEEGDWYVRARAVQNGIPGTTWSNTHVITSIFTGIRIGNITFSYVAITIFLLIILIISGGFLFYLTRRVRKTERHLLQKETEEAQHKAAEGFRIMRTSILEELQLIDKKSKFEDVTQEDLIKRERLLRELHTLEDNIKREIEDVQKLL